jgi:hypothetical protein
MKRIGLLLALSALTAGIAGCTSFLAAAAYIIKGHNVNAEFDGLKGKRVAVVCRPLAQLEYSAGNASTELAKRLSYLLKQHLRKIDIIDQDKINEWTDEHNWEDFTEIGEALDADLVLGIDLREFGMYQSMTLYQGHARMAFAVYDMRDGGQIIYQKTMPKSVYPPNTGIPTSEKSDDEFRRQYLGVLADEIGRHFYDHDGLADFAQDVDALH